MQKHMRGLGLAVGLAVAGMSLPAAAQTVIQGEQFDPSIRECLAALENGVVVPLNSSDARWRAEVYVFYRDNIFLIIFQGGALSCSAWST